MWMLYLRYDDQDEVKTYHVRAGNKAEAQEVLAAAREHGLSPTANLVEYAIFYSQRTIYPKECPNFHMYDRRNFLAEWEAVEQRREHAAD